MPSPRVILGLLLPALLAALLVAAAPPASAAPTYPVGTGPIVVSASRINPGGAVTVRACGYRPGTTVISTDRVGGRTYDGPTATVGSDGCASVSFVLSRKGRHVLSVIGTDGGSVTSARRGSAAPAGPLRTLSVAVTVAGSPLGTNDGGSDGEPDEQAAPVADPAAGHDGTGSELPSTGGSLASLLAALALLVTGGGLVLAARGSRRSTI